MNKTIQTTALVLLTLCATAALAVNDGGTGAPEKIACDTCTFWHWLASWLSF